MTAAHGTRLRRSNHVREGTGDAVGIVDEATNKEIRTDSDLEGDRATSEEAVEDEDAETAETEGTEGTDEEEEDEDDEEDDDEEGAVEEEEDESPFKFLEGLGANWFTGKSLAPAPPSAPRNDASGQDIRSPAASADDAEFYGAMIQMLTHVLGSSDSITWPNQPTPGSQLAPSPFAHPYSSPAQTPNHATGSSSASSRPVLGSNIAGNKTRDNKQEYSALQPMIQALIARLGKDHQLPRRPVGEQDLTALLQTLMQQQQRQQDQQMNRGAVPSSTTAYPEMSHGFAQPGPTASVPSSRPPHRYPGSDVTFELSANSNFHQPLHFADLDFEDEDEDDPDFNPDLNPDLPLPSAWSLAVRDVVASEESRAAAAAAAAAASNSGTPSGTQNPADMLPPITYRASNLPSNERSTMRSPAGDMAGRRTSFEQLSTQLTRRSSFAQPHTPAASTSASRAQRTAQDAARSATRQTTPPPSESVDASLDRISIDPEVLFSPSGRPIRASRKRAGSPAPGPRSESTRSGVSAASSAPPQTQINPEQDAPRKRGRKPVLAPGEAQRRRAQRNIEYQRMRRQEKKAEESEQSEIVLELKAEVKMLRAELERMRDENAMLRARRELDRLQRSSRN